MAKGRGKVKWCSVELKFRWRLNLKCFLSELDNVIAVIVCYSFEWSIFLRTCHELRTVCLRLCTRSRSGAGNLRPGSQAQSSDPALPGTSVACDWSILITWPGYWPLIGHDMSPVWYLRGLLPVLHPELGLSALHTAHLWGHSAVIPATVTSLHTSQHKSGLLLLWEVMLISNLAFTGYPDTLALGSSWPFLYQDMVLVNGEGVVYLDKKALT